MTKYEEIFKKLIEFAEKNKLVKAMVLFGSRVRTEKKCDEFSDYDIIFFVDDVNFFIESDEWLNKIEKVKISFIEETAVQDFEKRVFFDNSMDMDFIFYNVKDVEKITSNSIIKSWYAKGFQILVDKIDYKKLIEKNEPFLREKKELSEKKFTNLSKIFWFHTIWASKKLNRGEIWAAKNCIDGYLKNLLREALEYDAIIKNGADFNTWHDGRFFDEWANSEIKSKLNSSYGKYDRISLKNALFETMNLFSKVSNVVFKKLNYSSTKSEELYAFEQVKNLLN